MNDSSEKEYCEVGSYLPLKNKEVKYVAFWTTSGLYPQIESAKRDSKSRTSFKRVGKKGMHMSGKINILCYSCVTLFLTGWCFFYLIKSVKNTANPFASRYISVQIVLRMFKLMLLFDFRVLYSWQVMPQKKFVKTINIFSLQTLHLSPEDISKIGNKRKIKWGFSMHGSYINNTQCKLSYVSLQVNYIE